MINIKTICYVAHPNIQSSSSQQFLMQTGQQYSKVQYINLSAIMPQLNVTDEVVRLMSADKIIFQFPLYWYQAPEVLFEFINKVFSVLPTNALVHKYFSLVVVVGGKAAHYQAGGREGRTLSELLSNFEVLARHFKCIYLPMFVVHQFKYMNEQQKAQLMWRYLFYLENNVEDSLPNFQRYLIAKAAQLIPKNVAADSVLSIYWTQFMAHLEDQALQVVELTDLLRGEA